MIKMNKLEWNVYYRTIGLEEIRTMNIFEHYGFMNAVKKSLKETDTKEKFTRDLRCSLGYYFCGKCEWEIYLSADYELRENSLKKIDIYQQVILNFDKFVDYVWSFKGKRNLKAISRDEEVR